jgi:TatD DNase family protein
VARDRSYPPLPDKLPIAVVDNHTHIEPGQASDCAELTIEQQITQAKAVGVDRIVQCGCDLEAARWTAQAVTQHPALLGAIAIHPNQSARYPQAYPAALAEVADLAERTERIRAVGETGLDYYRTGQTGHQVQQQAFRDHIDLAKQLGLALQIHDRDAHRDVLDILKADGAPERTVFHCFSGDLEMAEVLAANGWYLSVAGTVSFSANHQLRSAVAAMPGNLLLVETDAPYLTPQPYRGRPNAPYMAAVTVRVIAEVRHQELADTCSQLSDNAVGVYGMW